MFAQDSASSDPPADGASGARIATSAFVYLMRRIDLSEIEQYAKRLHLSPQQQLSMKELYDLLAAQLKSLDEKKGLELRAQAERIAQILGEGEYTIEQSQFFEKHYRDVREFNRLEVALEEQFFSSLAELLDKSQASLLVSVRWSRERRRYPPQSSTVPGSDVDLIEVAERLEIDLASCDAFLDSYEYELGQLRAQRFEEDLRRRVADVEFIAKHAMQMDSVALNERATMLRRLVRVDKRLRAVNVVMLESLQTCLDEQSGRRVRAAARRLMYPTLFPDRDAESALKKAEAARARYADESKEAAAIDQCIRNFDARYEAIVKVLIEHVVIDREQFESTLFAFAGDREAQEALFTDLLMRREVACREFEIELQDLIDEFEATKP